MEIQFFWISRVGLDSAGYPVIHPIQNPKKVKLLMTNEKLARNIFE
jgi:hypothetical protein